MKKRTSVLTYYPLWLQTAWVGVVGFGLYPWMTSIPVWLPTLLVVAGWVAVIVKIRYDQRSREVTQTVKAVAKTDEGYAFTTHQSPLRVYRVHHLNFERGAKITEGSSLRFRTNMMPGHWNVTYLYA